MLEQKGIYTYLRTWYVYQHFLFDFPFDEIYVRLLFFHSRGFFLRVNRLFYEKLKNVTCEYNREWLKLIPQLNQTVKQDKIRDEPENRIGAVCVEYGRD